MQAKVPTRLSLSLSRLSSVCSVLSVVVTKQIIDGSMATGKTVIRGLVSSHTEAAEDTELEFPLWGDKSKLGLDHLSPEVADFSTIRWSFSPIDNSQ